MKVTRVGYGPDQPAFWSRGCSLVTDGIRAVLASAHSDEPLGQRANEVRLTVYGATLEADSGGIGVLSTTAANKLHAEAATHTIQLEQNVFPADSYNYTGGHSSNLPYTGIYVADAAEQASQGYEEVSFVVSDPGRIVAGTNYFGYLQWEQEADGGFLDFSPLLNKVEIKIEYGNKSLIVQNFDTIGRWQTKIANNK